MIRKNIYINIIKLSICTWNLKHLFINGWDKFLKNLTNSRLKSTRVLWNIVYVAPCTLHNTSPAAFFRMVAYTWRLMRRLCGPNLWLLSLREESVPNIGQFNFITCQVRVFYPGVSIEHLERQTNRTQTESNGCFNWMIPDLYLGNACFSKHPFKTGCLGYQVHYSNSFSLFSFVYLWLKRFGHFQPPHGHFVEGQAARRQLFRGGLRYAVLRA